MPTTTKRIALWGSIKPFAGGGDFVELEAETIRELLAALEAEHPATAPFLKEGIAVSIDGVVYQNSPGHKIPADAEIYLLPRLRGG